MQCVVAWSQQLFSSGRAALLLGTVQLRHGMQRCEWVLDTETTCILFALVW